MARSLITCLYSARSKLDRQCSFCLDVLCFMKAWDEDTSGREPLLRERPGTSGVAVSLTSSPLYCFRQCKKRQVFASQKETVSKSSPRFWWDEGGQTGVSEGGDGPAEHPASI